MTGRTIIIRQVASKLSKHSNFVVTEYISCQRRRRPSLMFSMFWMRKMLMSANLEWRVVREGSSYKQWVRPGWAGLLGECAWLFTFLCQTNLNKIHVYGAMNFVQPLNNGLESGWSPLPSLCPLRVNTDFKARWILNIRMRADQSPCPLIMVMWCNPPVPWWPISHVSLWPLLMLRLEITGEPVLRLAQCGARVSIVRPGPHTSPSPHPMSLDVSPAGPVCTVQGLTCEAPYIPAPFFLH